MGLGVGCCRLPPPLLLRTPRRRGRSHCKCSSSSFAYVLPSRPSLCELWARSPTPASLLLRSEPRFYDGSPGRLWFRFCRDRWAPRPSGGSRQAPPPTGLPQPKDRFLVFRSRDETFVLTGHKRSLLEVKVVFNKKFLLFKTTIRKRGR